MFYEGGKPGPAGDVRCPSWSPDGTHVVYGRAGPMARPNFQKLWSRNPQYELIGTGVLPAYDPSGERFTATVLNPSNHGSTLMINENGKPPRTLLERKDELILGPQWSPRGEGLIFGIGQFTAFLDFASGGTKPRDPTNGGAQIAMINADGTGFRQITSGANNNGFPAFAPMESVSFTGRWDRTVRARE